MSEQKKTFRFTEIMATMAVAAIFVVVAVPTVGSLQDQADVNQIVDVAKELSDAALQFRKDTGACAVEFTASEDGASYSHARYHELSMPQSIPGWRGPYLETPLTLDMNPFGGAIYLHNKLDAAPAHGFHLDGPASKSSCASGQFVVFHGVSERIAQAVDAILDKDQIAKRRWRDCGRVEWAPGGGGSLSICLLDNESEQAKK